MLFMKGHGGHAIYEYTNNISGTQRLARDACGFRPDEYYPKWDSENLGSFGYLCQQAKPIPENPGTLGALREIGERPKFPRPPLF